MSERERRVLQYLRVYGPCSVRTLVIKMHGRRTSGRTRLQEQTYEACSDLAGKGLAAHLGEALWDVTERGRGVLANSRQAELFRQ